MLDTSTTKSKNDEVDIKDQNQDQNSLKELSSIEDNKDVLERFIPITEDDIIDELAASSAWVTEQQGVTFRRICEMFVVLYHARFHDNLRVLKNNYLPFSPDRDTVIVKKATEEERAVKLKAFIVNINEICERANFELLDRQALNDAMSVSSPYGVDVHVEFDDFEDMALYYRGSAIRHTTVRHWKSLWLKKIPLEIPIYKRLFLMLKPDEKQEGMANNKDVDARCVYLKLFKNIPQYDLETLFPNTTIKMTLFDKVKLSVTGGGGSIAGIVAFIAKAGAGGVLGFFIALGGLAAVLWRQVSNVFSQRTKYMATLAKNLYYYNLNNNLGAISQVVDMAEGEDTKEAILAYFFLSAHADKSHNEASLDKAIEDHIRDVYKVSIDFEVSDGLRKLEALDLLIKDADGSLKVKDLDSTLKLLNDEWDDMYDYK